MHAVKKQATIPKKKILCAIKDLEHGYLAS